MAGGRGRSLAAAAAALGMLIALSGCADAELKAARASSDTALGSGCEPTAAPATLPPDFPALPLLPEGAVVTGVESRSGERTVVGAVVPLSFEDTLKQLRSAYEQAGLSLDHGEVEEHDAESDFHGHGLRGRWGLRAVPGCEASTTVSLVVAPAS